MFFDAALVLRTTESPLEKNDVDMVDSMGNVVMRFVDPDVVF